MSYLVPRSFFDLPALGSVADGDLIPTGGANISEDDQHIFVDMAVPGVNPDKLEVTFERGVLHVRTKDEQRREDGTQQAFRALSYRVTVPGTIDEQATPEAHCENGLLNVAFAKAPAAKLRQIEVKKGSKG